MRSYIGTRLPGKRKLALFVSLALLSMHVQAQEKTRSEKENEQTKVEIELKKGVQVKGKITDAVTGGGLAGIRITYKNISAAISDSSGNFSIKVPGLHVSVIANGDGFQAKEIALKGRSFVTAALYEKDYASFYEDITMPNGINMQSHQSAASVSVLTNSAWDRIAESPDAYLQGKVAGLQSIRRSGTPNIGANLFLRGYSSLYATNQPLIVVDDVVFDATNFGGSFFPQHYNNPLAFIDIRDIDNVTVIKDGTSLYGAKASNGVILINTIRARQEATTIDAALYGGVNFSPTQLPVMNAENYRIYLSEMLQSKGLSSAALQALPYMNDDKSQPDYYRYHNQNDWQKKVLNNGQMKNGYLKIAGGDNIAKYALSIGFLDNKGVIENTGVTRYNTRFNADFNLSKRLKAAANISFTYNQQKLKEQGANARVNPVYAALIKSPFLSTNEMADDGTVSPTLANYDTFGFSNPMAIINSGISDNKNYRFLGNVNFNYDLGRNFSLASTLAITTDKIRESYFIPAQGFVPDTTEQAIVRNTSGAQVMRLMNFYTDTRVMYNKIIDHVHQLGLRAGVRYNRIETEQDLIQGQNSATDKLTGVGYGLNSLRRIGGSLGESRWFNTYLNMDYNYSGRYFFTFNASADGSSRFGNEIEDAVIRIGDRNYGLFPSVSGAWLVSSESFMAGNKLIDLLKFRASVGLTGNDDIGNFTSKMNYVSQNLLGMEGLVRGNPGNPALQWESVTKLNAGVDLAILNERVNFSFDAYRNQTRKMITYEAAPAVTGMEYIITNSGGMKTSGWEAAVNVRVINQSNLKWDIGFNIAHSKTRITQLPQGALYTDFSGATYLTRVGDAPNLFYGYKTNGVYTSAAEANAAGLLNYNENGSGTPFQGGDIRFVNTDATNNVIDENDKTVIGNPNPDYFGAVSTGLNWKRWSLNALFSFVQGNDIYNFTRQQLESMSGYANQTDAVQNRWRVDGQQTNMPKAVWGDPMGNSRFSDRWIEDGSYFRLRTLSVSYQVPLKPAFVKYATIYLSGNNLFTLTKYKGYDPEMNASASVFGQGVDVMLEPQYRSAQLGIKLGL